MLQHDANISAGPASRFNSLDIRGAQEAPPNSVPSGTGVPVGNVQPVPRHWSIMNGLWLDQIELKPNDIHSWQH